MKSSKTFAIGKSISIILLLETHVTEKEKIKIYGYTLIKAVTYQRHGIATLFQNDLASSAFVTCKSGDGNEIE